MHSYSSPAQAISPVESLDNALIIRPAGPLAGTITLEGAKNAALVSIAALLLVEGKTTLHEVPPSTDVFCMLAILEKVGALVSYDSTRRLLSVDASNLQSQPYVGPELMGKLRASTLILGPLLARGCLPTLAFPGGDSIGKRPIDYHIRALVQMGNTIHITPELLSAQPARTTTAHSLVLEYPSVGATENIMLAAARTPHTTTIINAAIEPEIMHLGTMLQQMGVMVSFQAPATISIQGTAHLNPIIHTIIPDRLEAGTFLIAAAITGGSITIPNAPAHAMHVFLEKLKDMGHVITIGVEGTGVMLQATSSPQTTSLRTMPYPGFPTDLQAPMVVAQTVAQGISTIHETVYEARFGYVAELQRLGAQITVHNSTVATIQGPASLTGTTVQGKDIRAAAALCLAGLVAQGSTTVIGLDHIERGYINFAQKLSSLGALTQQPPY